MFSDPDPDADIPTPDKLEEALKAIHAQNPHSFAAHESDFEAAMLQLLSNQAEQMVIVPSDQLYIEALPGTHPILEDFKLIHRALDVKRVQAEVRHRNWRTCGWRQGSRAASLAIRISRRRSLLRLAIRTMSRF